MKAKVETSPMANFKSGSNKLFDNGLTTLIKLLVIAMVVYGAYQLILYFSLKDAFQELSSALKIFEGDPTQSVIAKDALVNFAKSSGITIVLSGLLIAILGFIYNLATTRVYINSVRGKDTGVGESVKMGLTRSGTALLFSLYVIVIIIGALSLVVLLGGILPASLLISVPAFIVLLVLLFIRLFYSLEILVDDKKPKVMEIFEQSKTLFQASSTAAIYYILLSVFILIMSSVAFSLVMNIFGAGPSNEFNLTTSVNDVVFNVFNYLAFSVLGFFLSAGFVEIYNQAKFSVDGAKGLASKTTNSSKKK